MSTQPPQQRWPNGLFWFLALIFLTVLLLPAMLSGPSLIGDGVDLYGTVWFYGWIADSLLQIRDPTVATQLFFPYGKDLFAHTGNNFLDAVMAAPFVWVFGIERFQPYFTAAILLFNAVAFRSLARRFSDSKMAVDIGSLLFMISPFCLSELISGRPTQALMGFSLFSLSYFIDSCRASQPKSSIIAGVCAALAGWTYWFGGYFLGLSLLLTAVLHFKRDGKWVLNQLLGLVVCFLLIAPALYFMFYSASVGETPGLVSVFTADKAIANNVSPVSSGYFLTEPAGFPMFHSLVWGGFAIVALLRTPQKWWVAQLVFCLIFATGPIWPVGSIDYSMPHYQALSSVLPFFQRLWFPYRMVGLALAATAIGITLFLNQLSNRIGVAKTALLALGLCGMSLWEQSQFLAVPLYSQPFQPPSVYQELRQSQKTVIELPLSHARPSSVWLAGTDIRVLGGIGENTPLFHPPEHRSRLKTPLLRELSDLKEMKNIHENLGEEPFAALIAQGFDTVIWDRRMTEGDLIKACRDGADLFDIQSELFGLLGPPLREDGAYLMWDLRKKTKENSLDFTTCCANEWPPVEYSPIEIRLKEHGRLPQEVDAAPCQKNKGE